MRSHSQYLINVQYSKGVEVFTVNLEVSILDTSHGYTAGSQLKIQLWLLFVRLSKNNSKYGTP